jgi:hypothetical protein
MDEEEDLSSYLKDTRILETERTHSIALYGELALEEAIDLS